MIRISARSSFSALARSSGTCAAYSPSSVSAHVGNFGLPAPASEPNARPRRLERFDKCHGTQY
jgi:hypothetical protein